MMVETRPTARVTFDIKNFDKPLMSATFINNDS